MKYGMRDVCEYRMKEVFQAGGSFQRGSCVARAGVGYFEKAPEGMQMHSGCMQIHLPVF